MKKIFSPAAQLINQLSFAQKFMLLAFIYLMTVSYIAYNLNSHLGSTIRRCEKQLQGVTLIKPIVQTIQLMQEHRGLELVVLSGNNTMRIDHDLKEQAVYQALDNLNQQWLAEPIIGKDWLEIRNTWQSLEQKQYSLTTTENFSSHVALIEKLRQFETNVADKYALNANSDIAIYYLVDTTIDKLPMALERLGQMRAFGSSILVKKQLTEEEKIRLFNLISEFDNAFEELKINLEKTSHYNQTVKGNLLAASTDIELASNQLITSIKSDILSGRFNANSDVFFKTATDAINKSYNQLYNNLLPSIKLLLEERIQRTKMQLLLNIGIALFALLVSVFIFIVIYRATVHSVQALAHSSKKFAEGDFNERVEIVSTDELSQIARSFNEMANGFCQLLEKQQEIEQRLSTIINSALDAVIQMNDKGLITGWSKQAEVIFGWTQEEVLGALLSDTIIPLRYRDLHTLGYQRYLKSGQAIISHSLVEMIALHRLGHEFPIEVSISLIKTHQGIEFNAFIRDITERKYAKKTLQESEMRFRQLLQDIPSVAVQSYDENGIIYFWNKASEHFYGYTREEVIGHNINMLMPDSTRGIFENNMRQIFVTKQPKPPEELTCVHKNGQKIDVYCSYAYVHLPEKTPEVFCFDINLTELKHSEAALIEKEHLLQEAQEIAHLGYYIADMQTGLWTSSTVLDTIFGIDNDFVKDINSWLNLIAPEYRKEVEDKFNHAVSIKSNYNMIYKIIRPNDGEIRWLLDSGRIEIDELNQTTRCVGTALDITERKAAEDELQVLSLAVQQSPNSIVITDTNANIQFANKAFSKVTGFSLQEAMGQNPRILHSGKTPKATFDDLWATLTRGEVWQGELINRRKDGSEYIELAIISPVRQPNGEVSHYLAVKEDITEKKRAETELRIAAAAFESQEAILVSDANNRILRVNQAFTDITGYSPEEVIGQNPSLLKSGQQDTDFYAAMWQSILTTGAWQGELWNQRKDGTLYSGWMTITVVKNEKLETTHHVATLTDMTERKLAEEKIRQLAFYDPLTELPNRRKLLDRLEFAIASSHRKNTLLAVLMLDLDYFKAVNDNLGHLAGDELLQQVAKRITSNLRNTDMVARLGGDEFIVLLEDIGHEENAARVANNIIGDLTNAFVLLECHSVQIGTSIGISLYPNHGDNATVLIDHADKALYQAKNQGRGCYAYFSDDLTHLAHEKLDLEARLRLSISQQELRVFYQPQVDIKTGKIIGAEALVRWQDPHNGFTLPSRFIPIAEENGLVIAINEWVFKETCKQGRKWLNDNHPPITLSVNISPLQLRRGDLNVLVASVLTETNFPADLLILEITEVGLIEHQDTVIEQFKELKKLGVRLAIDNFGIGYSSLSYLHRFPLDFMNIDKSFIQELSTHQHNDDIVICIIGMGHSLGFKVLAEGVETTGQLDFLTASGCDLYQGYIKSVPLAPDDFGQLLQKQLDESPS